MAIKSRRGPGRERGQSAVEFALVLPILLLLIFGLLEFGRVLSGVLTTNHCANELARFAVVGNDANAVRDYAFDADNPVCPPIDLEAEGATLDILIDYPDYMLGEQMVEVIVEVEIPLVVPVIRDLFPGGTFSAQGRAKLPMEIAVP